MKGRSILFLLITILTFSFFSCGDDEPGFGSVVLNLNTNVEGDPVEIEKLQYATAAGHTYSVVNLKYYLSDIVLYDDNGGPFAFSNVHLFDIHQAGTERIEIDNVPNGTYNVISFVFGLDEGLNVDGGLENTLDNINMEWPIPGDQGYHYMKFEGRYDSLNTGVLRSYNVHTGATLGNQNYIRFNLAFSDTEVNSNTWMMDLNMDLNEWFHNPYNFDFVGHERIMMDQDAQETLKANGADVFTIGSIIEN